MVPAYMVTYYLFHISYCIYNYPMHEFDYHRYCQWDCFFFKDFPYLGGKQMAYHNKQHMAVPALVAAALIIPHPQIAFAFPKALFNRPP